MEWKNLSKIVNFRINAVVVMFPYNQKNLFVPDTEDWEKILKDIKDNVIVIASPNGLKKAKPDLPDSRLIVTVNEMILNYWFEIRNYITVNPNIKYIKIVSSDIDLERLKRDFNLVFSDIGREFEIDYMVVRIPNSFWKRVYLIREGIVLLLPILIYKFLARSR